ncbi:TSUP family transporter [Butyricicoccus sp.]|uniref:TSUP family transporter n=1 Tax=Butyricicoccus sp. TaxID=2049021 RepID=UPI003F1623E0
MIQFLIVCPMVFLAGFVDAIAGGGGLISLPAYLLAGVPMHQAIATNKLSSATGTTISTIRYCRNTKVDWSIAGPAIILSLIGSSIGAKLTMMMPESVLKVVLLVILPVTAVFVFRKNALVEKQSGSVSHRRMLLITWIAALVIGCYDGFYGPGTGTFLILVMVGLAKMDMMQAAANTKLINLASNISALAAFLIGGKVVLTLGLAASVFSIAGHYTGSSMVMKNGTKIVKPIILVVLVLLFLKVIFDL